LKLIQDGGLPDSYGDIAEDQTLTFMDNHLEEGSGKKLVTMTSKLIDDMYKDALKVGRDAVADKWANSHAKPIKEGYDGRSNTGTFPLKR
jgi:hypothetical protein